MKNIKRKSKSVCSFSFQPIYTNSGRKVIRELKDNNATGGEISVHVLRVKSETLTDCINESIENVCFPDSFKEANINLIFKNTTHLTNLTIGL